VDSIYEFIQVNRINAFNYFLNNAYCKRPM